MLGFVIVSSGANCNREDLKKIAYSLKLKEQFLFSNMNLSLKESCFLLKTTFNIS